MPAFVYCIIAVAVSTIAAFFPGSAAVFVGIGVAVAAAIAMFSWREGILLAAVTSGGPVLLAVVPFPPFVRGVTVFAFLVLALWRLADMRGRARGAPLAPGRLQLFIGAAAFSVFVALFTSSEARSFPIFVSVVAATAVSAGATAFLRSSGERARGGGASAVPFSLDSLIVGLVAAEAYVALSFLSLSPVTLAAALTVALWSASALVIDGRTGLLTLRRAMRVCGIASVAIAVLLASVPWIAIR